MANANMILTNKCEKCIHSSIDDTDKAWIKIYCKIKNKTYYWGQCIPCDYIEVRKDETNSAD